MSKILIFFLPLHIFPLCVLDLKKKKKGWPCSFYPVVVHQHPQPWFDGLHDILQEVLLHLRAIVERQVAHVDGTSHFRQGHKLGEVVLILRLLRNTKEICEFFKLLKSNSLQKRTSRNSEYLTYQVVEVVGTTCCILEEGGIRIYIAIQQTIKDLKSDDWNWNEKGIHDRCAFNN